MRAWLRTGLARSPLDMQGLLQEYIDVAGDSYKMAVLNDDEMGKSVALDLVKAPPPSERIGASLASPSLSLRRDPAVELTEPTSCSCTSCVGRLEGRRGDGVRPHLCGQELLRRRGAARRSVSPPCPLPRLPEMS